MGRQGPAKQLVVKRPSSSLISPANVIPLIMQIMSCAVIQFGALAFLREQPWLNLMNVGSSDVRNGTAVSSCSANGAEFVETVVEWENTVLFLISCYQYLWLGVIYSKGLPHRQPLYQNCKRARRPISSGKNGCSLILLLSDLLISFALVLTAFTTYLLLHPTAFLTDLFDLMPYSEQQTAINNFRLMLLAFPVLQLVLSTVIEVSYCDRHLPIS